MPMLSSADTPPLKSMACLPVSTIVESGVMTRIPEVCISMVASAFQYGWAPTLTPATTTLISPLGRRWPDWVNSTIRRSTVATQSRFSEPLSMAMRAPADRANHSTGRPRSSARSRAARMRTHSASVIEPMALVGSPSSATRVMPSGYLSVGVVTRPTTTPARFWPAGRSTGTRRPSSSRSSSVNVPTSPSATSGSADRVSRPTSS